MGNLEGVFFQENTPEGRTETHKSYLFPYKQVNGRKGDDKWLRMTNAFILSDLIWQVQKSHAANREGSFKYKFIYIPLTVYVKTNLTYAHKNMNAVKENILH